MNLTTADPTGVDTFQQSRGRLFGIAYRMLGSVADAEDVLQEAWIRWQSTRHEDVREPAAFLTTITRRLSINTLQSSHSRHEVHANPQAPESVSGTDDPSLGAERAEALHKAMLILLGSLTPQERAAYVLREAFVYPYEQIAGILRTTPSNARQLVSRAHRHLASDRCVPGSGPEPQRLLLAFLSAAQQGNFTALEAFFTAHAESGPTGLLSPGTWRRGHSTNWSTLW